MLALPLLVLNAGSSSIKFSIYNAKHSLTLLYDGEASGIGTPEARITLHSFSDGNREPLMIDETLGEPATFRGAVHKIVTILDRPGIPRPSAIGHRVVHSGPKLTGHRYITQEVMKRIEEATPFAPLHQPIAIEVIQETRRHFPGVDHYACFDTVFHQSIPAVASTYPVSKELRDQGVRRYGFHGISCESILEQFPDERIPDRLICAHLGAGASITAIQGGRSIDTTMGLTPCGGILMGTRAGDLDPGLLFYLLRMQKGELGNPTDNIERLLNQHSGLFALSDTSGDMRVLRKASASGNLQAALAIEAFVISAKKSIGGFFALMGGVDALVFTGGIGEHDGLTRRQICSGLERLGILLDIDRNDELRLGARMISKSGSSAAVYVFPTQEGRMMASHVAAMLEKGIVPTTLNLDES